MRSDKQVYIVATSFFILLFCMFFSCTNTNSKKTNPTSEWDAEKSTKLNRQFSAEEQLDIQLFLARKPLWKVQKTGTGLHYYIYQKGQGTTHPKINDLVEIEYKISLLDGTLCYQTEPDEVEEIKVDKAQVESGIQEAIKLLKEGDKAMLIIPSHLAHGLVGDRNKIPPLSTLLVDISIYRIKPQ